MKVCVCGLLGSGKTTYALSNKKPNEVLLDYDRIRESLEISNSQSTAIIINNMMLEALKSSNNVYLVRTYPRAEEIPYIDKFIWINTEQRKCKDNLIKDNRMPKNIDVIQEKLLDKYYGSELNFEIINVFETDERWD